MKINLKAATVIINSIAILLTVYLFYRFLTAEHISDTFPFFDQKEIGILVALGVIINLLVYLNRSRQKKSF